MRRSILLLLMYVTSVSCGKGGLAPGKAIGSGIFHGQAASMIEHAVYDIDDRGLRKSLFIALSSDKEICKQLRSSTEPNKPLLLLGMNDVRTGTISSRNSGAKARDDLLAGFPNERGGAFAFMPNSSGELVGSGSIGSFTISNVEPNAVQGDIEYLAEDESSFQFNAAPCTGSTVKIRQLIGSYP